MREVLTERNDRSFGRGRIRLATECTSEESELFTENLRSRRRDLARCLAEDRALDRRFPVLSVLAPVMTQSEGEITYPGDPMCLYSALSAAVHRSVADAGHYPQDTDPDADGGPDTDGGPNTDQRTRSAAYSTRMKDDDDDDPRFAGR